MPSLSVSRHRSSPTYSPDGFNLEDNYNILLISEIHAFEEPEHKRLEYINDVADQINEYIELYDVAETSILGDTGSFNDVYNLLDGINDKTTINLVAGDEDKDRKQIHGQQYTGWFRQINHDQPFDVDVPYNIFDEGFETEIQEFKLQAAHHPNQVKREDGLNRPDTRDDKFLNRLFSVNRDTNENTVNQVPPPSLQDGDIFVYDHVHMPYSRSIGDKIVVGLGGRRHNYQLKADIMPDRSLHMLSFGEDQVNSLHFDAEDDRIFEHLAFELENGTVNPYDVEASRDENPDAGYLPIQSRFQADQISKESWESDGQIPPFWEKHH